MKEKKYHTGRIVLNYGETVSNGFPLVLIHGSGSIWQDWNPVIEAFSAKNHIFAVDLRGFGGSGRSPGTYDITTFTDDMADFIKGLVPSPPVVVGHSLGALITIDLAVRYPELLKAIVLEDPPVSIQKHMDQWDGWAYFQMSIDMIRQKMPRQEVIARFMSEFGYSPSEAERMAKNLEVIDPVVFEQILAEQGIKLKQDIPAALSQVQCPCLFVSSNVNLGSMVNPEDLPSIAKSLKYGHMALVQDAGHSIHLSAARTFNQVMDDFLSRLD